MSEMKPFEEWYAAHSKSIPPWKYRAMIAGENWVKGYPVTEKKFLDAIDRVGKAVHR